MIALVMIFVLVITSGCTLNAFALLPGTSNYKQRQLLRAQGFREQSALQAQQFQIEVARMRAIEQRYFLKEQEYAHKQLTTGGENG